jgi:nitrogen regulatory protein PII
MQHVEVLEGNNKGIMEAVSNFTQVVAILPKETAIDTIRAVIPPGDHKHVYLNARGTLYKDKWYQKLKPSISPEQIVIEFLVTDHLVQHLLDQFCAIGNLASSGTGILYSIACNKVLFFSGITNQVIEYTRNSPENENKKAQVIYCIIQKTKAEEVAIAAIRAGAHGPTVTYGQGKGIRDKMGILRIAISPEKAFIRVIVDDYNTEPVFEAMITAGKIDTPGMGFIYVMPLNDALVNVPSVELGKDELAHQYQIIKAIDDLKGGHNWRTFGIASVKEKRKCLLHLVRLRCVISRCRSQKLIDAAMNAGATGASINYGIEGDGEKNLDTGILVNNEVEIVEITIPHEIVDEVLEAMTLEIKENNLPCYIYVQEVNKAFTYLE